MQGDYEDVLSNVYEYSIGKFYSRSQPCSVCYPAYESCWSSFTSTRSMPTNTVSQRLYATVYPPKMQSGRSVLWGVSNEMLCPKLRPPAASSASYITPFYRQYPTYLPFISL